MTADEFRDRCRKLSLEDRLVVGSRMVVHDLSVRKARRWFPQDEGCRYDAWMKALPNGHWRRGVNVVYSKAEK